MSARDVHQTLAWFGKHDFFGIPCDSIAHLVVGFFGFILFFKILKSYRGAYLAVFSLELIKELLIDVTAALYNHNYLNTLFDVLATLLGALFAEFYLQRRNRFR